MSAAYAHSHTLPFHDQTTVSIDHEQAGETDPEKEGLSDGPDKPRSTDPGPLTWLPGIPETQHDLAPVSNSRSALERTSRPQPLTHVELLRRRLLSAR